MKRFGVMLLLAAAFVTVMGGVASAGPYDPDVNIDVDGNPSPGDTVPVVGSNWCPDSDVSIYLDGVFQGTAHTDSDGSFVFDLHLSKTISSGKHVVTVVGLNGDCSAVVSRTAILTIAGGTVVPTGGGVVTGSAAAGSALPFTGSNLYVGAMLLLAFVLVGAVALVAGRRRERPVVEEQ